MTIQINDLLYDEGGQQMLRYDPGIEVERHPLSEVWGDLSQEAMLDDFRRSVESQGIREPILLYDDRILDGYHRYQATRALSRPCPARVFVGTEREAAEAALASNLHRRHLSASQIADAVVRTYEHCIKHGGDRRSKKATEETRLTAQKLADRYGVSERTIRSARERMKAERRREAGEPEPPKKQPRKAKTEAKATPPPAPPPGPVPGTKGTKAERAEAAPPKQTETPAPAPEPSIPAEEFVAMQTALTEARNRIGDLEEALRAARSERDQASKEVSRLKREVSRLEAALKAAPPPPKKAERKRPDPPAGATLAKPDHTEDILRLHGEGKTQREIARETGAAKTTIQRVVARAKASEDDRG